MQPTRLPLQTRWIFLPTRCAAFARRGDLRRAEGQRVPPGNKRDKQICPRITRISANDLLLIEFRVHSRHSRASTLRHSHHPCDPWLRNLQRIFDHEQEHEYEEEIKSIGFDSCNWCPFVVKKFQNKIDTASWIQVKTAFHSEITTIRHQFIKSLFANHPPALKSSGAVCANSRRQSALPRRVHWCSFVVSRPPISPNSIP